MSFAPNDRRGSGFNSGMRPVVFWVLMLLLAVVLWQMVSQSKSGNAGAISYSDFMQQVDSKNVGSANFRLAQNTAAVSGSLKQPAQSYSTTVPRDSAAKLMDTLRQEGVSVQVAEGASTGSFLVSAAPIIILVGVWIFMMRRRQAARNANLPNQPTPGALG